jgi:hypothetical protein
MHYLNSTISVFKKTTLFIFIAFSYFSASAQENSPYSRFGLGDMVPAQNIVSRSMGGISAGFIDVSGLAQSLNLSNPAALGTLNYTIFDIAGEIDTRTLKSNTSPAKYKTTNTIISYLQLGFPITPKRMFAKGNAWNIAFGLKPQTRINYKIREFKRIPTVDSLTALYEGTGGLSQANFSTAVRFKNLSLGLTTGYSFGNRETSTKLEFLNDSIRYQSSNSESFAKFGGLFLNLGAQYAIALKGKSTLRIGASVNLEQKLKANRNVLNETFIYDLDGTSIIAIDTVDIKKEQAGTIKLPATYNLGFTIVNPHWTIGADVDFANWKSYRNYGETDPLQNTTKLRFGAQYYPAKETTPTTSKNYWRFVKYRTGFFYGNDYVKLNTNRPDYAFTLGAGFPLIPFQNAFRTGQYVLLNTGVEIGQRGNKTNLSIRENVFRINIGFSLSGVWFQKRKYD